MESYGPLRIGEFLMNFCDGNSPPLKNCFGIIKIQMVRVPGLWQKLFLKSPGHEKY